MDIVGVKAGLPQLLSSGLVVLDGSVGCLRLRALLARLDLDGLAVGLGIDGHATHHAGCGGKADRQRVGGVFFLTDDAFRKGEYIDIGSVMGTVERISVRSLQLRHHNGPVHTIPYGEIQFVTNYSRDWAIMKFELRIPFEADLKKVQKIIKDLGRRMIEGVRLHRTHDRQVIDDLRQVR